MSDRPTPETDAAEHEGLLRTNPIPMQVVTANFARKLERERDNYKWQLHIATGDWEQARQMERAWRKEETNEDYE
jgi:hypothetical protein